MQILRFIDNNCFKPLTPKFSGAIPAHTPSKSFFLVICDVTFRETGIPGVWITERRFFILKHYGGCAWDLGWLMVSDNGTSCPFEIGNKSFFLYSELDGPQLVQGKK